MSCDIKQAGFIIVICNKNPTQHMKKMIFGIACLLALAFAAPMVANNNEKPVGNPDPKYKSVTLTTSGSNKVATINAYWLPEANYYAECGDSVTLTLAQFKNGGEYTLLIKKTVAGAITVTTTASGIGGVTSPIAITGSTNTFHMLQFYNNGTVNLVHKE